MCRFVRRALEKFEKIININYFEAKTWDSEQTITTRWLNFIIMIKNTNFCGNIDIWTVFRSTKSSVFCFKQILNWSYFYNMKCFSVSLRWKRQKTNLPELTLLIPCNYITSSLCCFAETFWGLLSVHARALELVQGWLLSGRVGAGGVAIWLRTRFHLKAFLRGSYPLV